MPKLPGILRLPLWIACAAALPACGDDGTSGTNPNTNVTVDMRFRPRVDITVGAAPKALAVVDLNSDGHPDVVVARNVASGAVTLLGGKADGTFTATLNNVRAGDTPSALATGDFDGDGAVDAVVTNFYGADASVLFGRDLTTKVALPVGAHPAAVATADLNSDGKLDIVTVNQVGNTLGVVLNMGGQNFAQQVVYPVRTVPGGLVIADLNGDGAGRLDVAVTLPTDNAVRIYRGQGGGAFADGQSMDVATGQGPTALALGKLNGDDFWDLVVANSVDGSVSVLLGTGTASVFSAAMAFPASNQPSGVALGDLDGDGKLDVAVANRGSNSVTVLLGQGDGTLKSLGSIPVQTEPSGIAMADFDGDGALDIVVANEGSGTVSLLFWKK